jgi:3-isopropylmalate/(R)-2-methylmalate dehydratase small subunit
MDAFTTHTGTAAPLRRSNVDTDQIIPAEYLKRITRTGFADGLFKAWRSNEPDFVLNQPQYAEASILVTGPDFGTGSSREHAVWALKDGGFRVVISSRFADIFRNNSTKDGLLTVVLPQADVEALWARIEAAPETPVTVDLNARQVTYGDVTVPFDVDEYTRWRLLEGLDDVGLTERNLGDIEAFEATRPAWLPTTKDPLPSGTRTLVAGP